MRSNCRYLAALWLALVLILSFGPIGALADEGMFLPDTINRLPSDQLKKLGLEIPISDIYNPSGTSIKDAVVIVDGGTGEFVSPEGLLLTNHHVAFDALVSASDTTKDYATNGYAAHGRADELPAKDYTVTITQDLKDVTNDVLAGTNNNTPEEQKDAVIGNNIRKLEIAGSHAADGMEAHVLPMNEGLSYYQFNYLVLRDVRIVYAPPKNIGFFGGDPDNFEWPRHCGDFTFMRVYVGPDGKPASYAANNLPYKPKKFLPISLNGVKEGDFMMVMGYPGSTRRYRESYSVAYNQEIALPFLVDVFTKQIDILEEIGKTDPSKRIKLQSTIFEFSNSLKNFEGSVVAMRRAKIVEKKRADEAAFTRWVNQDPARKTKYGEVLPNLEKAYAELNATAQRDLLIPQLASVSGLIDIVSFAQLLAAEKKKPEAERNPLITNPATLARAEARIKSLFLDRNPTAERDLLVYLLRKADELPPNQKIAAIEKRFGNLQGDARVRAEEEFAEAVINSAKFRTPESLSQLLKMSRAQLRELHEPLLDFSVDLAELAEQVGTKTQAFNETVSHWRPILIAGMSEMRGGIPYPDANRTIRFTYGEVKGYFPREATSYSPFTTLAGVIEKDTGHEPFDVPPKLKQLYQARDFGEYATADKANVPVDFLSTTDIIGGNSGSPIMNGRGEQVGIIFDGNYEGLGNDFFYNDQTGRAIAVDIRYVLFITDKFGNAGGILKELELKRPVARRQGS